ncbi:MAG: hypothetical protein ABMB14_28245 [Myxococcota bacterium]
MRMVARIVLLIGWTGCAAQRTVAPVAPAEAEPQPVEAPTAPTEAASPPAEALPVDATPALGTRLVAALADPSGGPTFAALTADPVDVTLTVECGDPAPDPVRASVAGEAKARWHGEHQPGWNSGQVRTTEASTVCADGCCEVRDLGHSAHWLYQYCVEGGKVRSITLRDGC